MDNTENTIKNTELVPCHVCSTPINDKDTFHIKFLSINTCTLDMPCCVVCSGSVKIFIEGLRLISILGETKINNHS